MNKRLLFIYNPFSGKGLVKNNLADIIDIFVKAGYDVMVHPTQCHKDATKKVMDAAVNYDHIERIVCAGGDGTLDEVITGMMMKGLKCPVGYISAGSTNDFGNTVGISSEMLEAATNAVGDKTFMCDIGRFEDDYFVYVAAFGIFTDISYATDQNLKNMFGHAAYVLQGIAFVRDIPSFWMKVESGNTVLTGNFMLGVISNSNSVGGITLFDPNEIKLDDGLFEVMLVRTPTSVAEFNELVSYFAGLTESCNLVHFFTTPHITFTSDQKVPWAVDGEFGGDFDTVEIKNLPKMVEIVT